MANFLTSTKEEIIAAIGESHQRDKNMIAALSAKYPEHRWQCCAEYIEASAVKGRNKHWIKSQPINSAHQAAIGIGDWRLAIAEGETPEEAIDRVVLRMRQLLKDTEVLYKGCSIDE